MTDSWWYRTAIATLVVLLCTPAFAEDGKPAAEKGPCDQVSCTQSDGGSTVKVCVTLPRCKQRKKPRPTQKRCDLEGWLRDQILGDHLADLENFAAAHKEEGCTDVVPAKLLVDFLTTTPVYKGQWLPTREVKISNATVEGPLTLDSPRVLPFTCQRCTFKGSVRIDPADPTDPADPADPVDRAGLTLNLDRSTFTAPLSLLPRLHPRRFQLSLRAATLTTLDASRAHLTRLVLDNARLSGDLLLDGATLAGDGTDEAARLHRCAITGLLSARGTTFSAPLVDLSYVSAERADFTMATFSSNTVTFNHLAAVT